MRLTVICVIAAFVPGGVVAEPGADDYAAFETCVAETYADNIENFTARMGVPVICGARHIPAQHSCSLLVHVMNEVACLGKDRAFWQARLEENMAAHEVETIDETSLLSQGLERCAREAEGEVEHLSCDVEVLWRDAVITRALPVMDAVDEKLAK